MRMRMMMTKYFLHFYSEQWEDVWVCNGVLALVEQQRRNTNVKQYETIKTSK